MMKSNLLRAISASFLLVLLGACGAGKESDLAGLSSGVTAVGVVPVAAVSAGATVGTSGSSVSPAAPTVSTVTPAPGANPGNAARPPVPGMPPAPPLPPPLPKAAEAARFLTQATFGPTDKHIADVTNLGYAKWIDQQMSPTIAPPQAKFLASIQAALAACGKECRQYSLPRFSTFLTPFWQQAVQADNQLQLRTAFALSQIFVVSLNSENFGAFPFAINAYYDMLVNDAFGNFRKLMEDVTLQPAMGLYLTYAGNAKETATSHPDENYAREFMQLFTIGLNELNLDGTEKRLNGALIPTYTQADVNGLAKVFTGWSFNGPDQSQALWYHCCDADLILAATTTPMQMFEPYHSVSEKKFLGVTIPAGAKPDGKADLKIALDRIFAHPNVGPFIGRQLIQRLVTSNPTPAYIARVAGAFNDNGAGVRGDMRAVIQAILLDPEARSAQSAARPGFGKLREPVLRLSNWMRSFNMQAAPGGSFAIGSTSDPAFALNQTPMAASSVFNFYSPSYVAQGSPLAMAGLKSPEMQLVSEVSVAGSANFLLSVLQGGFDPFTDPVTRVFSYRLQPNYTPELAVAADAAALVDRIDLKLSYGAMPAELKSIIVAAVQSIPIPAIGAAAMAESKLNRVKLAIYMTLITPEYLSQR